MFGLSVNKNGKWVHNLFKLWEMLTKYLYMYLLSIHPNKCWNERWMDALMIWRFYIFFNIPVLSGLRCVLEGRGRGGVVIMKYFVQ